MTTLLTGANGFVGGAILRLLLSRGEKVRVLVRRGSDLRSLSGHSAETVYGDLRDRGTVRDALKGCARVYHVAALYSLWLPDPKEIYAVNVGGTATVLEEAWRAGVERIVYTSTVGALGLPQDGRPADERTPVDPKTLCGDYKKSKYLAEQQALRLVREGAPVVIVNPSTPVGPGDIKPTPTGQMVVDYLKGKMWAYLDTGLNLIDVQDVAEGHLLAMAHGKVGEKYILGHENMTLRQFFILMGEETGIRPPSVRAPHGLVLPMAHLGEWISRRITGRPPRIPLAAAQMARYRMFFDPSKAVRELGLPQRPVRQALRQAVDWFRQNGYVEGRRVPIA